MITSAPVTKSVQPTIRIATQSDADALARLRYGFRASTGPATEPEAEFIERCSAWMRAHLQNDAWHCWLAEVEQHLIGTIWLQLVEKIPNPQSEAEHHAYITNFYIKPEGRRRGIGSQMLRAAIDWCEAREIHAVILWPTERSRSLYQRHGFAVRDDILELVIKPPH